MNENRLEMESIVGFFDHYLDGILTEGLVAPLSSFSTEDSYLSEAIESWRNGIVAGLSFRDSLTDMHPRFPLAIEALLSLGESLSMLDVACEDIISALKMNGRIATLEGLSRSISKLEQLKAGQSLCEWCLNRDFEKVVKRYILEQAHELIIEQQGESYLHQRYIGVKVVQVSEACHSIVYQTLLAELSSGKGELVTKIDGQNRVFEVTAIDSQRFVLNSDLVCMRIRFLRSS